MTKKSKNISNPQNSALNIADVTNRYLIEYKNEWGANRQTYIEAINSEEARKIFYETYQSATICYTQVL